MLKAVQNQTRLTRPGHFAIVASKFNAEYVDSMLNAAREVLSKARAKSIEIIRVPGAFEIPVVAARMVKQREPRYSAVICMGVIMRGETTHAQHIAESVSLVLAQLQTAHLVPVINGVYLFENHAQARTRCLDPKYNRGIELANAALAMTQVMRDLSGR